MKRLLLNSLVAGLFLFGAATTASAKYERLYPNGNTIPTETNITPQVWNKLTTWLKAHRTSLTPDAQFSEDFGPRQMRINEPRAFAPAKKSPQAPRGKVYANITSYNQMFTFSGAFWGEIDMKSGDISPIYYNALLCNGNDYDLQGGAVYDNHYYTLRASVDQFTSTISIKWIGMNLDTGEFDEEIDFGNDWGGCSYSITYDPAHEMFHMLSFNATTDSFSPSYYQLPLSQIKDGRGLPEYICDIPKGIYLAAICYNPLDQQVYAFDDFNTVYIVDQMNGKLSEAGMVSGDSLFLTYYSGQITYSPLDHCFVLYYLNMTDSQNPCVQLMFLDPETWEAFEGPVVAHYDDDDWYSSITNPFASSLICLDPFAVDDAPAMPALPVLSLEKAATTGSLTFTVPETAFSGLALPAEPVKCLVKLDDKVLFEGELAPGAEKTIDFSEPQGLYQLSYVCSNAAGESPVRKALVCVGHDNPAAPGNLVVNNYEVSWTAPTTSLHNGYVDYDALTYDIYLNDVKQNADPVAATSFTLPAQSTLENRTVSVIASANGQSSPAAVVNSVVGPAYSIPLSLAPTQVEAATFYTVNADRDDVAFNFQTNDDKGFFTITSGQVAYSKDDWLFLPKVALQDIDKVYSFAFNYTDPNTSSQAHIVDIVLATAPQPEAVVQKVNSFPNLKSRFWTNQVTEFFVDQPGEYYIGLHVYSGELPGGICLADFSVDAIGSAEVPADAKVTLKPADKGALSAEFTIEVPTVALSGSELPADAEVTYTIVNITETDPVTDTVSGHPGETLSKTVNVEVDGVNRFSMTPSTSEGRGITRYFSAFIGEDVPQTPAITSFKTTEDNLQLIMEWEPVGEVGPNGGYADPAYLRYDAYQSLNQASQIVVGSTTDTKITVKPQSEKMGRYTFGVAATNRIGRSPWGTFQAESIGEPFESPMVENFNTTGFNYPSQWVYVQHDRNNRVEWDNTKTLGTDFPNLTFNQGGMIAYNTGDILVNRGHLLFPKVSTIGLKTAAVTVRYWEYRYAPRFEVSMRSGVDQEFKSIGDFTPECDPEGGWKDVAFEIPEEYLGQKWAQARLTVYFGELGRTQSTQYGIFDCLQMGPDVEYDLKLNDMTAPERVIVGERFTVSATVLNCGKEAMTGSLRLELLGDGDKVLASSTGGFSRIATGRTYAKYEDFEMLKEFEGNEALKLRATVIPDGDDQIERNNVREAEIELLKNQLPSVGDLSAKWSDDRSAGLLSWSEPSLLYGDFEDFEADAPFQFTDKIGVFKNVDMDKQLVFAFQGLEFFNDDVLDFAPCAWMTVDTKALNVYDDARIYPHSGKQYIMARNTMFDEDIASAEDLVQSSDWLISPEVAPGSKVSFWYNTLDSSYTEYVALYVSKTTDNPEDFEYVRTFSKIGSETWEKVAFTMPEDAKYFALVYCSWNCLAAMLDDISFTPVKLQQDIVDHYALWRFDNDDWSTYHLVADGIKDLGYADETAAGVERNSYRLHTFVERNGKVVSGPASNVARLWASGVADDLADLGGVYGGAGEVRVLNHEGAQLALYTTDGKLVKLADIASSDARVPVEAGIYVAKVENAYVKIVVK